MPDNVLQGDRRETIRTQASGELTWRCASWFALGTGQTEDRCISYSRFT